MTFRTEVPKVGDVWILEPADRRNGFYDITITSIGRKWAYFDGGPGRFSLDEHLTDNRGVGARHRVFPSYEAMERSRRIRIYTIAFRNAIGFAALDASAETITECARSLGIAEAFDRCLADLESRR